MVRVSEEVKIMKAEQHAYGRGFNKGLVMKDVKASTKRWREGTRWKELVAVAEIDGTVTKHLYAVAFAAVLMA